MTAEGERSMGEVDGGVRVYKQRSHTSTSPYTFMAYRGNFTFRTTEQFNCVNFCCAVCHNLCYSYSQSEAPFSPLTASTIHTTILI